LSTDPHVVFHQRAAAAFERLKQLDRDAEGRKEDDVVGRQRVDRLARVGQEAYPLRTQPLVDVAGCG